MRKSPRGTGEGGVVETLYKVIYTGRLQTGADRDKFVAQFSKQFGVSEAQALQLSDSGKEMVIKKNAKLQRAEEYKAALEAMGMVIRLEGMDGKPIDAAAPPPAPGKGAGAASKPRCPKCNSTHIVDDECQECGVIVSRYKGPPAPPAANNPYAAPSAGLYEEPEEGEMSGPVTVPAGHGLKWLSRGFWHFRQNIGPWLGAFVVWIILSMVLSVIPFLGALALMLISPIITAGFMIGAREQDDGADFEFQHLFAGFSANGGQLALVGLLYLVGSIVIGVIAFFLLGGMMMGIMMGGMGAGGMGMEGAAMAEPDMGAMMGSIILMVLVMLGLTIPLLMAYWFAPALVALEDMSAITAMRTSFMACIKNILPFLIYGVVALILMIIAAIPFALGFLILFPVLIASIYVSYRDIFYGPTRFD